MRPAIARAGWLAALFAAACATQTDHFYLLNTLPTGKPASLSNPPVRVRLEVKIPALVDRAEMVLNTSDNGILILDHERWAAALSDQVADTLARDIEARRSGLLITDNRFDAVAAPPVTVKVDIIRMSARRGAAAALEAHWRIIDAAAGLDAFGREAFEAPIMGDGFAAVAMAYSQALAQLANRLEGALPRP